MGGAVTLTMAPRDDASLAVFAARLRVMAAVCPDGSALTFTLPPEAAREWARVLDRVEQINRDGVVAVGVVEVEKPLAAFEVTFWTFVLSLAGFSLLAGPCAALAAWIAGAFA